MTDAEILAGLTKAQREAILEAEDRMSHHGGYPYFTVRHKDCRPDRSQVGAEMSEREELEQAFAVAFPEPPRSWKPIPIEQAIVDPEQSLAVRAHTDWRHNIRGRFYRFLDAEAYLDAAMMLVPDDMRDEIEITTLYCVARVGINLNHGPDGGPFYGEDLGNSIPLALCRAAIKAREVERG